MRLLFSSDVPVIEPVGPELAPGDRQVPVQVVIYMPTGPVFVEGLGILHADGTVTVDIPLPVDPPTGTPIQIILYLPMMAPVTIEGTTTPADPSGAIGISTGTTTPPPSSPAGYPTSPTPTSPAPAPTSSMPASAAASTGD